MKEAKDGIGQWIEFYNREPKHQTLGTTSDMMYGISSALKLGCCLLTEPCIGLENYFPRDSFATEQYSRLPSIGRSLVLDKREQL